MNTQRIVFGFILWATTFVAAPRLCTAEKPEEAARAAAEKWLALVDHDQWAESWKSAAALLQEAVAQEPFEKSVRAARKPLGALVSRKLKSAQYTKTIPGAPDGEYVILQFETVFAQKKSAVETITPLREKDGAWRVSGYFIK